MGILTYSPLSGGWLSGSWSKDSSPTSPARQRLAKRFDMALPENQRKLVAVEQLPAAGRPFRWTGTTARFTLPAWGTGSCA
jgi:aryl-alcohol dehydrogenase-like predicted oxidoreductase